MPSKVADSLVFRIYICRRMYNSRGWTMVAVAVLQPLFYEIDNTLCYGINPTSAFFHLTQKPNDFVAVEVTHFSDFHFCFYRHGFLPSAFYGSGFWPPRGFVFFSSSAIIIPISGKMQTFARLFGACACDIVFWLWRRNSNSNQDLSQLATSQQLSKRW